MIKFFRKIRKQLIIEKPREKIENKTIEMSEKLFKNYKIEYAYHFPNKIIANSMGKVSEDGRNLYYSISIPEVLKLKEDITIEIEW